MTSKLSARQRELLTKMADGWFISGHASFPEWEWEFYLWPKSLDMRVVEPISPWPVLRLKELKYIEWNGGDVMGSFVHYALTVAGRAVVAANCEQEDE